jgi:hypothetical protein
MGEIEVRGAGALEFCQRLTANDVARLQLFQAQYSFLLNEQGGVIDDVIIYRVKPEAYFICVNASNIDKDFAWLAGHADAAVEVENQSAMYAQLALQGPAADAILQPLTAQALSAIKSFQFQFADVATIRCMVARTGYTGEQGFELYCHCDAAERLWDALMAAGEPHGLLPPDWARDPRLENAPPTAMSRRFDDAVEAGRRCLLAKPAFSAASGCSNKSSMALRVGWLEALEPGIPRGGYGVQGRRQDWRDYQRDEIAVARQSDRPGLRRQR